MAAAHLKAPATAKPDTRWVRYWCEGKEQFESAVLAQEIAARCKRETREIYHCTACGRFHIGSQSSARRYSSKATAATLIRFSY